MIIRKIFDDEIFSIYRWALVEINRFRWYNGRWLVCRMIR